MATILFRIFLLYKLLNVFFLYLVPKKLRIYLPSSWYQSHQHHIHKQQLADLPSPRMDTDELKLCFQMFDRNGDGQISKQELNDSLEKIGIFISDSDLTQMIEKVDANGDGSVDIDEFRDLYGTIMQERDNEEEADMKEAFNVFDQNGDGFISADELKSVLESLGLKDGKIGEDCMKMITKVDVDGDGMVDFNEFKEMMKGGAFAR